MRYLILLFGLLVIPQWVHATENDQDEDLVIRHQASLATHLGLTPQETIFLKPRNFRVEQLNDMTISAPDDELSLNDDSLTSN